MIWLVLDLLSVPRRVMNTWHIYAIMASRRLSSIGLVRHILLRISPSAKLWMMKRACRFTCYQKENSHLDRVIRDGSIGSGQMLRFTDDMFFNKANTQWLYTSRMIPGGGLSVTMMCLLLVIVSAKLPGISNSQNL